MKIRYWASLSLATALLFGASQASATLVQATAQSSFTSAGAPSDSFNVGYYCFQSWHCSNVGDPFISLFGTMGLGGSNANFIFDTDLGVISHGLDNSETLTWDSAMGTLSPLVSGTFAVGGIFSYVQDLSDATSFTITRSAAGLSFIISGDDYRFAAGRVDNTVPPDGSAYSLAAPYNPSVSPFGFLSYDTARRGSQTLSSQFQWVATLAPLPIPEPSTWGLLIAGFAGAGAALRFQRRRSPSFTG